MPGHQKNKGNITNADREKLRGLIDFDDLAQLLKKAPDNVRLNAQLKIMDFVFPRIRPESADNTKKEKDAQTKIIDNLFGV